MRKQLTGGLALIVIGPLAVWLGSVLDLELDATIFLGIVVGAALALVPDRDPAIRLGAFAAGVGAAWLTYLVRAGYTPDSAGGRATSMALLVLLCVGITAVSLGRLPLWAVLLGAGTLSGGYEAAYVVAPSQVVSTSLSAVTAVLLTVAAGYLAGSFGGATGPRREPVAAPPQQPAPTDEGLGLMGGAR